MSESRKSGSDSSVHEASDEMHENGMMEQVTPESAETEEDETQSNAPSELSEIATNQLLSLTPRAITPTSEDDSKPPYLIRPWGFSHYDDYDVITVYGLRDDHETAWTSRDGKPWLRDKLFKDMSIRQLNYHYDVDDLAAVFQIGGIEAEARNLIRAYNRYRQELPETETGRPIIWVCHDIGGTIVKQVLIEATRAKTLDENENAEAWEQLKQTCQKIVMCSTTIMFLGTPHKSQSIDTLQHELHNLMSLPGPKIKHGILDNIRTLAHQVNKINQRFLSTKLFSRLTNINIHYLLYLQDPEVQDEVDGLLLPSPNNTQKTSGDNGNELDDHQSDGKEIIQDEQLENTGDGNTTSTLKSPPALLQFPEVFGKPFSRYSLNILTNFERYARMEQSIIDHAGLIRGDEVASKRYFWVSLFARRFADNFYPLKISNDLIRLQVALLSLVPPTRMIKVHMDPHVPDVHKLPFLDWFISHEKFVNFQTVYGSHLLHVEGDGGDESRSSMISQYLFTFYEAGNWARFGANYGGSAFYFEFDRFDSRYNNIRAMMITFISEMSWRSWSKFSGTHRVFDSLDNLQCFSLPSLFKLFTELRRCLPVRNFIIMLGRFDNCLEEERVWFLTRVLEQQGRTELNYRIILTTSGRDGFLDQTIDDSQRLRLVDCPTLPRGYAIDETDSDGNRLAFCLEDVIEKRPILSEIKSELESLITECQATPHLGYRILDWLGRFGRGRPVAQTFAAVAKLRPLTPENVMFVLIESLPKDKKQLALLIYQWVRYAMEPLTIEELAHALIVSAPSDNLPLADADYKQLSDEIREIFCGIVKLDSGDVKFAHESFYTIIPPLADDIDDQDSSSIHGLLSQACLRYLMRDEVKRGYAKLSLDNFEADLLLNPLTLPRDDFLSYAVRFWPKHYQLSESHRPFDLAMEFLQSNKSKEMYRKWTEAHYLLSNPFTRIHRSYTSPLPVMASLGFEDILVQEIEKEKDDTCFKENVWLAITEAARHGHADIVRKLLSHADAEESGLQDSIFWALFAGNDDVLSILLEKIRSLESFSWPKSIASRAAAAGFDSVIAAISKAGGDLDEPNSSMHNETPLHTAILWGQKAVVNLLIDLGVNLSARDGDGRTPLLLAASIGDPKIVQALLNAKASVEDKDEEGISAVNTAIDSGAHAALKPLLEAGAEFRSGEFEPDIDALLPPIILAAKLKAAECIRLLVDREVDVNTESKYGTPLYILCRHAGCIKSVELLLQNGASPTKFYTDKEMLISHALLSNSENLVGGLIDKGAELDVLDTYDGARLKTPLTFAIARSTIKMVEYLLGRGASVDYIPDGAESPLLVSAFWFSNIEKAKLLLSKKADLHWRKDDGWGPLEAAYDLPDHVSLFLEHGVKTTGMCRHGTALMMAARWDYTKTLKILLAHKNPPVDLEVKFTRDPNHADYNCTALQVAIKSGNYECTNLLLDAGAQLDDTLNNFKLMIQSARDEETEKLHSLIQRCLGQGAKVDHVEADGNTALHGINTHTQVSTIQLLLSSGALLDVANSGGRTPLAVAVESGNVATAKFLILIGARTNLYNPNFGTLFHLAHKHLVDEKVIEMVKLLFEAKADPSLPSPKPECESFLCYITSRTSSGNSIQHKLCRYLIEEAHVDPNIKSGNGLQYPLIIAACVHDTELVEYLIRRGADPNVADSQGRRALHYIAAKAMEDRRILKVLEKAGSEFQATDNFGRTPLHLAAGHGYWSMCRLLINRMPKGFDINIRDADGWTPLMWACKAGSSNSEIVRELVNQHADIWPRSNDGEWSALKLACFSAMSNETQSYLMPSGDQKERVGKDGAKEVWNPGFHTKLPWPVRSSNWCDSCLLESQGPWYKCSTCEEDIWLCFKCFPHRKEMHNADHDFKQRDATQNKSRPQSQASQAETETSHVSVNNNGDPIMGGTSLAGNTDTESEHDGEDDDDDDDGDESDD